MKAELIGEEKLKDQMAKIVEALDQEEVLNKLIGVGELLSESIKSAAPRGPTGKLSKAVVCKRFSKQVKMNPAIFVAIDRKKAPHAHLVEYGTVGFRIPKAKKRKGRWVWYSEEYGKFFSAKKLGDGTYGVGPMPANPFFRTTVDSYRSTVLEKMKQTVEELITELEARK